MKTAQVNGENIVLKEIEDLKLNGKKGAIVKVLGCGLCGSDIVKFRHKLAKDGAVLGHEIVAIIDEINSDTNFNKGDKIVTSHHIPCFECTYCKLVGQAQPDNKFNVKQCLTYNFLTNPHAPLVEKRQMRFVVLTNQPAPLVKKGAKARCAA